MSQKARLTFCSPTFACRLKCQQCRATSKATGARCKRRACMGVTMCTQHWRVKYGVKSAASIHGKGLFACKTFSTGQWVCPYGGEVISPQELEKRYPLNTNAPYTLTGNNRIEDGACHRGLGSMANTADASHQQENNVTYAKSSTIMNILKMKMSFRLICFSLGGGDICSCAGHFRNMNWFSFAKPDLCFFKSSPE